MGSNLNGHKVIPVGGALVPILLFLHGRGEAGTSANGAEQGVGVVKNHSPLRNSEASGRFAIAAPQAPIYDQSNVWRGQLDEVAAFVDEVKSQLGERYDQRLFVSGFSQGGTAAAEYSADSTRHVTAWLAVDGIVGSQLIQLACEVPHLSVCGPFGLGIPREHYIKDGSHGGHYHSWVADHVFQGAWRLPGTNQTVYDWMWGKQVRGRG